LIKKVWAKFDGMDLQCVCDEHHRKCKKDTNGCKEYVVKFIEVDREDPVEQFKNQLEKETANLRNSIKKFQSEISKNIKKFKI
jgi:hypothetical protein